MVYRVRAGTFRMSAIGWMVFSMSVFGEVILTPRLLWLFTVLELFALVIVLIDQRRTTDRAMVFGENALLFSTRSIPVSEVVDIAINDLHPYFVLYLKDNQAPFRVYVPWADTRQVMHDLRDWWVKSH